MLSCFPLRTRSHRFYDNAQESKKCCKLHWINQHLLKPGTGKMRCAALYLSTDF